MTVQAATSVIVVVSGIWIAARVLSSWYEPIDSMTKWLLLPWLAACLNRWWVGVQSRTGR